MNRCTLEQARAAKPHAAELFARVAEVAGIGITRSGDGYGLKVNLSKGLARPESLPAEVDGVPVTVEIVGGISKYREDGRTEKRRID